MAVNTRAFIARDLAITLQDGTLPAALDLTLSVRRAGCSITDHGGYQNQVPLPVYDQAGNLIGLGAKARGYTCKLALAFYMLQLTHGSTEVFEDWVKKTAATPFASRVNTNTKGDRDTQTAHLVWTDVAAATHTRDLAETTVDTYGVQEGEDGVIYQAACTCYGTDTRTTTA